MLESLPQAVVQGWAYFAIGHVDFFGGVSLASSVLFASLGISCGMLALSRNNMSLSTFSFFWKDEWKNASSAGDTLCMHNIALDTHTVDALGRFLAEDTFITKLELSRTRLSCSAAQKVCIPTAARL